VVHERMPVILEREDWAVWLGETEGNYPALLRPSAEGILRIWPVDKRVGNVRNDGPELLLPHISHRKPRRRVPLRRIRRDWAAIVASSRPLFRTPVGNLQWAARACYPE
jgi:hypothetical protein